MNLTLALSVKVILTYAVVGLVYNEKGTLKCISCYRFDGIVLKLHMQDQCKEDYSTCAFYADLPYLKFRPVDDKGHTK